MPIYWFIQQPQTLNDPFPHSAWRQTSEPWFSSFRSTHQIVLLPGFESNVLSCWAPKSGTLPATNCVHCLWTSNQTFLSKESCSSLLPLVGSPLLWLIWFFYDALRFSVIVPSYFMLGRFHDVWYSTERVALQFFFVLSDFSNLLTYASELRRSRCGCTGVQSRGESAELLFARACFLLLAVPGAVDSTCRTQCQCWSRAWTCDPLWVFLQRPSEGWPTEILCSINKHNGFSEQEGTLYLKLCLISFFSFVTDTVLTLFHPGRFVFFTSKQSRFSDTA